MPSGIDEFAEIRCLTVAHNRNNTRSSELKESICPLVCRLMIVGLAVLSE